MLNRTVNLLGALGLAVSDRLAASAESALDYGVPGGALVHLSHCERPTIESLSRVLGLSHSATVRLVDRLVAKGSLERTDADWDRRAVALRLSTTAREAVEHLLRKRSQTLQDIVSSALSGQEQAVLARLSEKLLRAMTRQPDDLYRICRLCDFEVCSDCPVADTVR